ncbi:MAG: hypothetical protein NWF12_02615 [Candidatus Bathyarchaeota archaeon]|nr:hypothetical protein [Candidatus Bathyarchaeota archaeon]
MAVHGDFDDVLSLFEEESSRRGLRGVIGVASFDSVHDALLPVQQEVLKGLVGDDFNGLMASGSFICIAYAYPEPAIDAIAVKRGDGYDRDAWNTYAREYKRLNRALDETATRLAHETGGIPVPATTSGVAAKVENVEDYYGLTLSHRVVAEQAGLGWRGKNELIVHPEYGCAIRLASVITEVPLERTAAINGGCGGCRACLEACSFLRFKDRLDNYREQCRRYIVALDLESEVCGKCVKACYRDSVHSDSFRL